MKNRFGKVKKEAALSLKGGFSCSQFENGFRSTSRYVLQSQNTRCDCQQLIFPDRKFHSAVLRVLFFGAGHAILAFIHELGFSVTFGSDLACFHSF